MEDKMSVSGISTADPVTPASWAPAPQQVAPAAPVIADHDGDKDSASESAEVPSSDHKVDVRA
jgi:hypothetical protein